MNSGALGEVDPEALDWVADETGLGDHAFPVDCPDAIDDILRSRLLA